MTTASRRAAGLAAVSVFAALATSRLGWSQPPAAAVPAQARFINERLAKVWKDNHVTPSPRASDYEFIRRVFLDLIGRIPRPEEVQKFVGSGANRPRLIHDLLYDTKKVAPGD